MKMISTVLLVALAAFELGCGYGTKATTPAQPGVTPNITQLMPNSANHSATAAAMTLTVNGTNFSGTSVVNWGSSALSTTLITSNQLTAMVPGTALATAGTVSVTVTNPGMSGGIYGGGTLAENSNSMTFTIN